MVGVLLVIKPLKSQKLTGFLTNNTKFDFVKVRESKGFLHSKAPTSINSPVHEQT